MESNSPVKFRCPLRALPAIGAEVAKFAHVVFENASSGFVTSISGRLKFTHDGESLQITILENHGHFPRAMLVGGMRQVVEEVVEQMAL